MKALKRKKEKKNGKLAPEKKNVSNAPRRFYPPKDRRRSVCEARPREPEVADLQLAVRVGEDVLRLQVAVEDLGRVHILEPAQQLVEEELVVLRREVVVGLDDLVQIRLHQLEDDVDVAELPRRRRQHDVLDVDDVGVAQQAQQLDLAQDARRVRDVVEHVVDLLDRDPLARRVVDGRADDAVAALADDLADGVAVGLAVLGEEVGGLHLDAF